ncbi:MAG: phospholipase D-like domain-containing protein [Paracoccaceae bacterium]
MFWIDTHIALVVVATLALFAAIVVIQQRRTPQSAVAWVLFIALLPYVALPIFLALGFRKRGSRFPPIRFSANKDGVRPVGYDIAHVFTAFGLPAATSENRFTLHETGEDAYADLFGAIEGATERLDVIFYLLADDPIGERFVRALARKAQEGVRVRLILDRLGALKRPRAALRDFSEAGGRLRYFSPFLHAPDNGHMNLRNHRKMVIADGATVFAGGRNVGQEYLGPDPSPDRWVDLSFLVEGPVVQSFLDVYDSDWDATGKTAREPSRDAAGDGGGSCVSQFVPSGPDMRDDALHDTLLNAIHTSRRRVWIATPYFLPTEQLSRALTIAARRGIDVRLLVPVRSNQRMADFARGAYLRNLWQDGCRVLLYRLGMMHAKMGVIDDCAWVGSANFDVRSMLLNFETALFLYDPDCVGRLADWFEARQRDCDEGIAEAGLARRVTEGLFRLGAPML